MGNASLRCDEENARQAIERYLVPKARLDEGRFLGAQGCVTACIDLSDGLLGDARHIAEMSQVAVFLNLDAVPIAPAAAAVAKAGGIRPIDLVLKGGEDFELLFTVVKDSAQEVLFGLEKNTGTAASIIGEIGHGPARVCATRDGEPVDMGPEGFEHFSGRGNRGA
jgi:thiamine-monophosphate kinase